MYRVQVDLGSYFGRWIGCMKTWMEGCNQHPAPPRSASYGCIAKWSACSLMFCVCSYGVLLLCCCIAVVLYLQLWCFAILLPTMMTTTECTNLFIFNNSLSPKAEKMAFAEYTNGFNQTREVYALALQPG